MAVQTGIMNLPFSLEHTGPAWTPQYTLTPSAFNSWLWEEGHLVCLEGEWWRVIQSRLRLGRLVGSGFGQDQAGHLLAVQGWVPSEAKNLSPCRGYVSLHSTLHRETVVHHLPRRVGNCCASARRWRKFARGMR